MTTLATWRRVQLLCTETTDWLVFCICLHGGISGMCVFIWIFPPVFPQRGFWRGFFPWACWQHVLNKFVLCWLIPVFECVFLCVVWATCFTCFVSYFDFCMLPDLCTLPSPRFLHGHIIIQAGIRLHCMPVCGINSMYVCTVPVGLEQSGDLLSLVERKKGLPCLFSIKEIC